MDKYQAKAKPTVKLSAKDFKNNHETAIYWLGFAGVMINSHGTIVMIDPILSYHRNSVPPISETGEQLLVLPPIDPAEVGKLDAVLYTHSDYDHMGQKTVNELRRTGAQFHSTGYAVNKLREMGVSPKQRNAHQIGEKINIGNLEITLTPAQHSWQLLQPEHYDWHFGPQDCCGFKINTPDGVIWIPGDTNLMPEHLQMTNLDVMFIDFSADQSHWGRDNAIQVFNHYRQTDMIMYHYGTAYGPDIPYHNANPDEVRGSLNDPHRLHALAPGEKYVLKKK